MCYFKGEYHFDLFFFSLYSTLAADWKVTNIECVLERLLETCPNLEAISVSGWKEFTGDHLAFLVQKFKSLQRIDLSSVNVSIVYLSHLPPKYRFIILWILTMCPKYYRWS